MSTVLDLPGTNGNQASAPDTAALSFTGDIDIRCKFSTADLTPAASMVFVAKWGTSNQLVYSFELQGAGGLVFRWSATGSAQTGVHVSSTQIFYNDNTSIAPREPGWVRVAFDVNNGAAGNTATFYTSIDGTTWDELGTPQTVAGTTSLFNGSSAVTIGNRDSGNLPFNGQIYEVVILEGIGGTVRADPDFTDGAQGWVVGDDAGDTGSDGVNTWTLAGVATIQNEDSNMGHLPVMVLVQAALGSNLFSSAITWTDITEDVRTLSFDRGRFYELDRVDMGTATLELENFDGKYNSHNTTSPYYPNVKPNVPIRIRAVHNGTVYPLWYGFVDRWPVTFPGNIDSLVSVECSDLFKMLARARARQAGRVKLVESLNPVAWWRMSGDATEDTAGAHGLSWSGGVTTEAAGHWTGDVAVTLDGVNDHASIDNEPDVERERKNRSYEFWVRPTAAGYVWSSINAGGTRRLISVQFLGAGWVIGGAGNVGTAPNLSVAATVSTWHHLVISEKMAATGFSWDRSLYFNGAFIATQNQPDPIDNWITRIGSENGSAGSWFQGDISEIVVYPTALTAADVSALYAAQFEAYTTQRTDERIEFLLTDPAFGIGGIVLDLDLDEGASEISGPNSPVDVSALEGVMVAVDTERGLGFMTGSGAFRFQNRYYRMFEQDTPVTTFNQTHYDTPVIGHDDDLLYNEAQVAPSDESEPFVVEDAASVAENGRSTLSLTIYPADPNEAYDAANYLVARYAETMTRLKNLHFVLEEADTAATIGFLLGAELSNRYNIEIPLAGDDLDVDVFLEHIHHTIDLSHVWTIDWELSSAAQEGAFWLLGVTDYSELGVTTVLGY